MAMDLGILGFAHGHVDALCAQWRARPELGVTVAAGWDHDPARLSNASSAHGIRAVDAAAGVVTDDHIGAVLIGAETAYHADLVDLAAAAGKPIILYKPMALTIAEADRIVTAVEASGVPFTMAWQMRLDPQNVKMKELLDSGELGKVFMVRRRHGLGVCLSPAFASSWHVNPAMNRDIWADDAAHPVDFIHWLLGVPETVTAEIESLWDPAMPMDNGIAIYRYPGGPIAEVCCSFTLAAGENTTEIVAEKGVVVQNYGDAPSAAAPRAAGACGLKWYLTERGDWICSDIPSPTSQGERIAAQAGPLAEFLRGERPPIATAQEGRTSLRMVLACYVSSREGRRVRIDEEAVEGV